MGDGLITGHTDGAVEAATSLNGYLLTACFWIHVADVAARERTEGA